MKVLKMVLANMGGLDSPCYLDRDSPSLPWAHSTSSPLGVPVY